MLVRWENGRARKGLSAATKVPGGAPAPAVPASAARAPATTACRTIVAGSARSAHSRPARTPGGNACGDGRPSWPVTAVPVRDRTRAEGTVQRNDRGPRRSARNHSYWTDRAGRWRFAPSAWHERDGQVRPGHARLRGVVRLVPAAVTASCLCRPSRPGPTAPTSGPSVARPATRSEPCRPSGHHRGVTRGAQPPPTGQKRQSGTLVQAFEL